MEFKKKFKNCNLIQMVSSHPLNHSFVKRDKVRFDMADADKDSILNFEEFSAFQHPEEFKYMSVSGFKKGISGLLLFS